MVLGVQTNNLLKSFISEDIGKKDITTKSTPNPPAKAYIKAEQRCMVAGTKHAKKLFQIRGAKARILVKDGMWAGPKQKILEINSRAHPILEAERTALNLLSHLSAIATTTYEYASILKKHGSKARICATRKTIPGLRALEKEAVIVGGGLPHRMGLYDMALIKDNHLRLFGNDISHSIESVRAGLGKKRLEVEVSKAKDAIEAAKANADIVMLDNMRIDQMKKAINQLKEMKLRKSIIIEVSGRVTKKRLKALAQLDADWISTSKIITCSGSCEFSLDIHKIRAKGRYLKAP